MALLWVMSVCSPLQAQDGAPSGSPPNDGASEGAADEPIDGPPDGDGAGGGVAYQVELLGVQDDDLRDTMESVLNLNTLIDRRPATLAGLARRIEGDEERLRTVMRSEGYWDGTVASAFDDATEPPTVRLTITLNKRYTFGTYNVRWAGTATSPQTPEPDSIGFVEGAPARGADIVKADKQLVAELQNTGRPLAREVDRVITVDHRVQKVNVVLTVDPGPFATYGPLTFEGLERTKEDYLRQWITWKEGETFDQKTVDKFLSNLRGTGLFGSVGLKLADTIDAKGELPMIVTVTEGKQRTIGVGAGYSTDRGAGGRVFWRHRNLFGRDEDLELAIRADFLEQQFTADFIRPNFGVIDRELFAQARAIRSDTDAFDGYGANATVGLRWPLSERWKASAAGAIEFSSLDDDAGNQNSFLFGIPASVSYEGQDDDLNPTEGVRFDLFATPVTGVSDKGLLFLKTEADLAGYQPLDSEKRFVLAGRVRVGSIVGEQTLDIPANRRFYAGGGGSIRGFGFQKVGPQDADGNPVGGRSLFLVAAEARIRVWGDIGIVPFINGGNVYDQSVPSFDDPLDWAAGIGARYHTPAGPLRFDIAFPLTRRSDNDPFQFYISLGQAF